MGLWSRYRFCDETDAQYHSGVVKNKKMTLTEITGKDNILYNFKSIKME